jgi:cellulose synthase/poly-beta-1,6-N-acetylglucosamine synthase-like glycosyltransferase
LEAQGSSSSKRRSAAGVKKKATSSPSEQDPSSVSVIIPVFNEVGSIRTLVERVGAVMRRRGAPYEIICVDDGSTDGKNKELSLSLSLSVSTLLLILLLMQEAPSF